MTFDPNVPNAGQSPGLFPAQMNTDLARLKTIINAEHVFNDTAAVTDGVHRYMTTINRSDPGSLVAGTNAVLYTKTIAGKTQLFFYNGVNVQQVTPFAQTIKAMVNFDGTQPVGVIVPRSQINITTVNKTATGKYTLTFTTAIANDNYVVVFGAMRSSSGSFAFGTVEGGTYTDSVKVGSLKVVFSGTDGIARDVLMGNVAIMSAV